MGAASISFYASDAFRGSNTANVTVNVAAVAIPTPTPVPGASPTPTSTPDPNEVDAPSMSGWGLASLVAGMLAVMVIALRRTSDSKPVSRLYCLQRQVRAGLVGGVVRLIRGLFGGLNQQRITGHVCRQP